MLPSHEGVPLRDLRHGITNGASDLNAGKLVGCPRLARICSLP